MSDDAPMIDTRMPVPDRGTQAALGVVVSFHFDANDENYWRSFSIVARDPTRSIVYVSESAAANSLDPARIAADLVPLLADALDFLTPMV